MATRTSGQMRSAAREDWQGSGKLPSGLAREEAVEVGVVRPHVGPAQPSILDGSQAALTLCN